MFLKSIFGIFVYFAVASPQHQVVTINQSMPITTDVLSFNPDHGEVCNIM
jgi:hypothetical protein